jgi:hypothetical protein
VLGTVRGLDRHGLMARDVSRCNTHIVGPFCYLADLQM